MPRRQARPPRDIRDLEVLRARESAARDQWQAVVDEAASLHGFDYTAEDWPRMATWYADIPSTPPSPRHQTRWLAQQRVIASLTRTA